MKRGKLVCLVIGFLLIGTSIFAAGKTESTGGTGSLPEQMVEYKEFDYPIKGIGWNVSTDVVAKGNYLLACVVKNTTNPYMIAQLRGFEEAGKAMGFKYITLAPAKQDNVEEQAQIVEDLIQRGVHGIAIHPADSIGIVPAVEKAVKAGIPVAVIGTNAKTDMKLVHLGTAYYMTGYVIAEWVAEALGGKGKIINLSGPPQAQNAHERDKGIHDSLARYPEIKIIAEQPANFRRTDAMQAMENLIQKFGSDFDAVIGANDEEAMGALQAIEAAGLKKDFIIAGFDANEDFSRALLDGRVDVTFNSDPPSASWLAAAYLIDYLDNGTLPPPQYVPYPNPETMPEAIITQENVREYIEELAWWKTP